MNCAKQRQVEFERSQTRRKMEDSRGAAVKELNLFDVAALTPVLSLAARQAHPEVAAWRDPGFDELIFFWNNLPRDSRVEVYLPALDVEYLMLLRNLRRAPQTVRVVDEHTLSLRPEGVTYLAIPNLGPERIAALLTVALPDGVKAGEVYSVDALQTRALLGMVLGAFRLTIPVHKAAQIYARAARLLPIFEERLKLTEPQNRWYPILINRVDYPRARAHGLAEEAAEECESEPDRRQGTRVRLMLERIKVLDASGPLVHGSGEVSLHARVTGTDGGGSGATTRLPETGAYPVNDSPGGEVIDVNREIFSAESDEKAHACSYRREFKGDVQEWLRAYRPSDESRDPENVGDWQVWYRIEKL
jgi:hypothetical protein